MPTKSDQSVQSQVDAAKGKTDRSETDIAPSLTENVVKNAPPPVLPAQTTETANASAVKKRDPAKKAATKKTAKKGAVKMPKPNKKVAKQVARQAKADDKRIVAAIESPKATDVIVSQIITEVRSMMPRAIGDLTDKEFEKVVREQVDKVSEGRLEDRSTPPMTIARIKTDVKTRLEEAVKQSKNKAGSQKLRDAQIDVSTGGKSPMPASVESLTEVAESVPDFNSKEHLARVEKEQKRLDDLAAGRVNDHADMTPERTYHFQEKMSAKQLKEDPNARGKSFVGRLADEPKSGKVEVAVIQGGRETGRIKSVDFDNHDVRVFL